MHARTPLGDSHVGKYLKTETQGKSTKVSRAFEDGFQEGLASLLSISFLEHLCPRTSPHGLALPCFTTVTVGFALTLTLTLNPQPLP
jgi:hypothetical protein